MTSTAGAPNEASASEEGGSAGQTSAAPVKQGAAPGDGTPTSASGGCAVAFGATNFGSAGLLMFGLGAVLALKRRRDK